MLHMIKKALLITSLFMLLFLSSCAKRKPIPYSKNFFAFGVESEVIFYGYSEEEFNEHFEYTKTYLSLMNKLTDRYQEYPDTVGIYYLNHHQGEETKIDKPLFDLLYETVNDTNPLNDMFENQYFSIGIGAISDLYKDIFDNCNGLEIDESIYPSIEGLSIDFITDQKSIVLDRENSSVIVPIGMSLDLGAVTKGYCFQKLREYYDERNLKYTIDAGQSTIFTSFGNPYRNNDDYIVALKDPDSGLESSNYYCLFTIPHNKAISTSGDYQKYFLLNGKRHSHILDSSTKESVLTDIRSITVVTDSLYIGDIMSTVLYMAGSNKAIEFAENHGNIDIIIYRNDSSIYISDNIRNAVKVENKNA